MEKSGAAFILLLVFCSLLVLLLVSFAVSVWASSGWSQTYGGAESEYAFSVITTSDGGYAITGYTYSIGAGNSDAWLIKTDEQGVIPEFPTWIILPLFLFITLCAVATKKKAFHQLANTRT